MYESQVSSHTYDNLNKRTKIQQALFTVVYKITLFCLCLFPTITQDYTYIVSVSHSNRCGYT